MVEIGKIAKVVTVRGKRVPDVSTGNLPSNCYILWARMMREAIETGAPHITLNDVAGLEWKGSLTSLIYDVWKDMPQGNDSQSQKIKSALFAYGRQTGNYICTERGGRSGDGKLHPSTWFIREDWDPRAPDRTIRPVTSPTYAELKVTAAEAGEDRAPEPVTTGFLCGECKERFETQRGLHSHAVKHKTVRQWTVEALERLTQPAPGHVVHKDMKAHGFTMGPECVRRTLHEMASDPESLVVLTFTGNSPRYHLSPGTPATPQAAARDDGIQGSDDGALYKCREPDCGYKNPDATARRNHEDRMHADSPHRTHKCDIGDCEKTYYTANSLFIHQGLAHSGVTPTVRRRPAPAPQPAAAADVPAVTLPLGDPAIAILDVLKELAGHRAKAAEIDAIIADRDRLRAKLDKIARDLGE